MVTPCPSPGPIFSLAASCRVDINRVLRRYSLEASVDPVTSFGKRIDETLSLYLELSKGRYASLSQNKSQSEMEIGLQRVTWSFFEHELQLVARFIGIPYEYVEKYENPPVLWVSASPTTEEKEHWHSVLGSVYPYMPC